jgi:transcriptional regulator with XRE-family HTH domain
MAGTRNASTTPVGELLRRWRSHRRLSQLDLSVRAGVSTRHLSYVETGRSQPSRELVLLLAHHLAVPLRDQNGLLLAAGYAPVFAETPVDDSAMWAALDEVLAAHEPWPAIVVDRRWDLVAANRAAALLVEDVEPHLLGPPTNVLRVCLHPDGLARRIVDLPTMAAHVLAGLQRQVDHLGDPELVDLLHELRGYPGILGASESGGSPTSGLSVTMRLRRGDEELSFLSMIATFGTAVDATLSELTLETFLPADPATATALRSLATLSAGGPRRAGPAD